MDIKRDKEVLKLNLLDMYMQEHPPTCMVLYRLPRQHRIEFLLSNKQPQTFTSIPDKVRGGGFFVASFSPSEDVPCLFIRPEGAMTIPTFFPPKDIEVDSGEDIEEPVDAAYAKAFARMKQALAVGEVEKIVLARNKVVGNNAEIHPVLYFMHVCSMYPDCYVAYFNTPQSGAWLTITPEVLLQKKEDEWETMALAGTMPIGESVPHVEDFDKKNRREQRLVADYIVQTLQPLANEIRVEDIMVKAAGAIAHLCSPIRFTSSAQPLRLLQALHPTPAVCGLPLNAAREVIRQSESTSRRYYAGFSGPLNYKDETAFYVTLRCAQLHQGQTATLYAGSGLLSESSLEDEWLETCRKMQTIDKALYK